MESQLVSNVISDEIPDSHGWLRMLEDEKRASQKVYAAKPRQLRADFSAEKSASRDYSGREFLELLQNADDAAVETNREGRIRIEISPSGLIFANTGMPFRKSGLESILTAHVSDKHDRKKRLIGAKGLGFRSILNWTDEPVILSGDLQIAFGRDYARACVATLAQENESLREMLAHLPEVPAPLLGFPCFGTDFEDIFLKSQNTLLDRALNLHKSGYDTVIAAPFKRASLFDDAVKQADEFDIHFLLFVQAISRIELVIEGHDELVWSKTEVDDGDMLLETVKGDDSSEETWIVRTCQGDFPPIGNTTAPTQNSYELSVALCVDGNDNSPKPLHCYFPTKENMPLPGLFHATLDLEANRKHLVENSVENKIVLQKLGEFHAITLEQLLDEGRLRNCLELLVPQEKFPTSLLAMERPYYEEVARRKLTPCLDGSFKAAADAVLPPFGGMGFLPSQIFSEFTLSNLRKEREFLEDLPVSVADLGLVFDRLDQANITLSERADLIVAFADLEIEDSRLCCLLIDENRVPLKKNQSCFPPPTGGKLPTLPRWSSTKFMNPELWHEICDRIDGNTRDRARKLKEFGVEEYDIDGVVRSLVNRLEKMLENSNTNAGSRRRELIGFLVELFFDRGQAQRESLSFDIMVLSSSGDWKPAREIHLGRGYGREGNINAELYCKRSDLLLATPLAMEIEFPATELREFMRWIGVNEWPREVSRKCDESDWPTIKYALPETITVHGRNKKSDVRKIDIEELVWGDNVKCETDWIEDIRSILSNAPPSAVIAWLGLDSRFYRPSFHASLSAKYDPNAKFREYADNFDLPDLVKEVISSHKWLEDKEGNLQAPKDLLLRSDGLEKLVTLPAAPKSDALDHYEITREDWERGLLHAGVSFDLQSLGEEGIYRLMLLHSETINQKQVVQLYKKIFEIPDFDPLEGKKARDEYIKSAKVLSLKGDELCWNSPHTVYYAPDRSSLPASVARHVPLIDLPARRSTKDAKSIFGIQILSKSEFQIHVQDYELLDPPIREPIIERFNASKDFIRTLRRHQSGKSAKLGEFNKLVLQPISRLTAKVMFQNETIEEDLPFWTHLLDRGKLFVVVDPLASDDIIDATLPSVLGDAIAELFNLQGSPEITSLLAARTNAARKAMLLLHLPALKPNDIEGELGENDEFEDEPATVPTSMLGSAGEFVEAESKLKTEKEYADSQQQKNLNEEVNNQSMSEGGGNLAVTKMALNDSAKFKRKKIALRSSRQSKGAGAQNSTNTGQEAEELVFKFEVHRGRFPHSVAHIQGFEAYGCDLLSFETEGDREQFLQSGNEALVLRFIEVKSGISTLSENEWESAKLRAKNYFLYGVSQQQDKTHTILTTVASPMSHSTAQQWSVSIKLGAVPEQFREEFLINME